MNAHRLRSVLPLGLLRLSLGLFGGAPYIAPFDIYRNKLIYRSFYKHRLASRNVHKLRIDLEDGHSCTIFFRLMPQVMSCWPKP